MSNDNGNEVQNRRTELRVTNARREWIRLPSAEEVTSELSSALVDGEYIWKKQLEIIQEAAANLTRAKKLRPKGGGNDGGYGGGYGLILPKAQVDDGGGGEEEEEFYDDQAKEIQTVYAESCPSEVVGRGNEVNSCGGESLRTNENQLLLVAEWYLVGVSPPRADSDDCGFDPSIGGGGGGGGAGVGLPNGSGWLAEGGESVIDIGSRHVVPGGGGAAGVRVGGLLLSGPGCPSLTGSVYLSHRVVRRITKRLLLTAAGTRIELYGLPDIMAGGLLNENGGGVVAERVLPCFLDGFPVNWRELLGMTLWSGARGRGGRKISACKNASERGKSGRLLPPVRPPCAAGGGDDHALGAKMADTSGTAREIGKKIPLCWRKDGEGLAATASNHEEGTARETERRGEGARRKRESAADGVEFQESAAVLRSAATMEEEDGDDDDQNLYDNDVDPAASLPGEEKDAKSPGRREDDANCSTTAGIAVINNNHNNDNNNNNNNNNNDNKNCNTDNNNNRISDSNDDDNNTSTDSRGNKNSGRTRGGEDDDDRKRDVGLVERGNDYCVSSGERAAEGRSACGAGGGDGRAGRGKSISVRRGVAGSNVTSPSSMRGVLRDRDLPRALDREMKLCEDPVARVQSSSAARSSSLDVAQECRPCRFQGDCANVGVGNMGGAVITSIPPEDEGLPRAQDDHHRGVSGADPPRHEAQKLAGSVLAGSVEAADGCKGGIGTTSGEACVAGKWVWWGSKGPGMAPEARDDAPSAAAAAEKARTVDDDGVSSLLAVDLSLPEGMSPIEGLDHMPERWYSGQTAEASGQTAEASGQTAEASGQTAEAILSTAAGMVGLTDSQWAGNLGVNGGKSVVLDLTGARSNGEECEDDYSDEGEGEKSAGKRWSGSGGCCAGRMSPIDLESTSFHDDGRGAEQALHAGIDAALVGTHSWMEDLEMGTGDDIISRDLKITDGRDLRSPDAATSHKDGRCPIIRPIEQHSPPPPPPGHVGKRSAPPTGSDDPSCGAAANAHDRQLVIGDGEDGGSNLVSTRETEVVVAKGGRQGGPGDGGEGPGLLDGVEGVLGDEVGGKAGGGASEMRLAGIHQPDGHSRGATEDGRRRGRGITRRRGDEIGKEMEMADGMGGAGASLTKNGNDAVVVTARGGGEVGGGEEEEVCARRRAPLGRRPGRREVGRREKTMIGMEEVKSGDPRPRDGQTAKERAQGEGERNVVDEDAEMEGHQMGRSGSAAEEDEESLSVGGLARTGDDGERASRRCTAKNVKSSTRNSDAHAEERGERAQMPPPPRTRTKKRRAGRTVIYRTKRQRKRQSAAARGVCTDGNLEPPDSDDIRRPDPDLEPDPVPGHQPPSCDRAVPPVVGVDLPRRSAGRGGERVARAVSLTDVEDSQGGSEEGDGRGEEIEVVQEIGDGDRGERREGPRACEAEVLVPALRYSSTTNKEGGEEVNCWRTRGEEGKIRSSSKNKEGGNKGNAARRRGEKPESRVARRKLLQPPAEEEREDEQGMKGNATNTVQEGENDGEVGGLGSRIECAVEAMATIASREEGPDEGNLPETSGEEETTEAEAGKKKRGRYATRALASSAKKNFLEREQKGGEEEGERKNEEDDVSGIRTAARNGEESATKYHHTRHDVGGVPEGGGFSGDGVVVEVVSTTEAEPPSPKIVARRSVENQERQSADLNDDEEEEEEEEVEVVEEVNSGQRSMMNKAKKGRDGCGKGVRKEVNREESSMMKKAKKGRDGCGNGVGKEVNREERSMMKKAKKGPDGCGNGVGKRPRRSGKVGTAEKGGRLETPERCGRRRKKRARVDRGREAAGGGSEDGRQEVAKEGGGERKEEQQLISSKGGGGGQEQSSGEGGMQGGRGGRGGVQTAGKRGSGDSTPHIVEVERTGLSDEQKVRERASKLKRLERELELRAFLSLEDCKQSVLSKTRRGSLPPLASAGRIVDRTRSGRAVLTPSPWWTARLPRFSLSPTPLPALSVSAHPRVHGDKDNRVSEKECGTGSRKGKTKKGG
ncbi:hypothetical protein CBR_g4127 [Chara braunii]|uniref:Uncharacterized protein n=1 Tax=Chara braunii TaxID=69332 RepID=A0A388KHI1_CHABU|nr:hypothetical protein CBR_g4127 [Chara braunii]|eukprot:GBG69433.1 hypothetical protein CBR_g4127 [Chara braunii]